jgi:hypothetical protein
MYAQNTNQAYKDTSDSLTRSQQVANEVMDMLGNVKMAVYEQNHQLKVCSLFSDALYWLLL